MTVNNPNIIFISLSVKICLCIDIVEIKLLSSLSQWKTNFREQFIRLVEISFYIMYFSEYASSIISQKKPYYVRKITLEKGLNGLYD